MNFYIITGILLIALGTGSMVYGFSIIVGILVNALGTGSMVYGQLVKSKVDSAEVSLVLQDKVDDILKRIDEVRGGEKDEVSAGNIKQIEQEFKDWAVDFLKNRELRKVELARTELDLVDVQLKVSNELRPIFEYVLETIESLAHAYIAESGETIKVNFPPLPTNLYSEGARNYDGNVIFPNMDVWKINFFSSKPPRINDPPRMYIDFTHEVDSHSNSFLSISISDFEEKEINVRIAGPNIPTAEGVEGKFALDSYRDSLKTIMRRIFEAQLLRN